MSDSLGFGKSAAADEFRRLYFDCIQAQKAESFATLSVGILKLQTFLEAEVSSNPSSSKYAEPSLEWCRRQFSQAFESTESRSKRVNDCSIVRSKANLPARLPTYQSGVKARLSKNALLADLLSDDLDTKLKVALQGTPITIGSGTLRETSSPTEAKPSTKPAHVEAPLHVAETRSPAAPVGRQPLQQLNQRSATPPGIPPARKKIQESKDRDTGSENEATARWKRKRMTVPAKQDFYTCSPDDCDEFETWRPDQEPNHKGPTNQKANRAKGRATAHASAAHEGLDGGFATAKAVLAAENERSGRRAVHQQSSDLEDHSPRPRERHGKEPWQQGDQAAGRRPVASGLRRTQPAQTGPRGAFVPPFVKKAMDGPKDDQSQGALSTKTLEMLGDAEGNLPEALQKLDPNILELVCNEILDTRASVSWEDIAGQEDAKGLVQELVVWPMHNPHLFTGARAPPRGLLLFGPPGTGKTLIGRAIASNIKATFFNISASSLTSKWIGEGEKMVRALFAVAAALQPAVIFMDEIDSVLSARKAEGEHEASRRLKTELLVQMEGVDPSGLASRILLVGATNRPEELDEAARRRMPKQLYIPLPCSAARESMLRRQLGANRGVRADLPEADLQKIVAKTQGYSGSDMRNLIQEASQGPVRDAVKHHGAGIAGLAESDLRPVILKDFQIAARAQRASVEPSEIVRYEHYDTKHGARYAQRSDQAVEEEEEDW